MNNKIKVEIPTPQVSKKIHIHECKLIFVPTFFKTFEVCLIKYSYHAEKVQHEKHTPALQIQPFWHD